MAYFGLQKGSLRHVKSKVSVKNTRVVGIPSNIALSQGALTEPSNNNSTMIKLDLHVDLHKFSVFTWIFDNMFFFIPQNKLSTNFSNKKN